MKKIILGLSSSFDTQRRSFFADYKNNKPRLIKFRRGGFVLRRDGRKELKQKVKFLFCFFGFENQDAGGDGVSAKNVRK